VARSFNETGAKKMSENFLGYTAGLECWIKKRVVITKVEYSRESDGVCLRAVSGSNLEPLPHWSTKISTAEYENRPVSANSTTEAIWALRQLRLQPAALDDGEFDERE
jgi:hypothetical protein